MTIDYLTPHVHKVYNTVSGNPPQFHRDQWVCSFFVALVWVIVFFHYLL
jgi:hypothetical protein